jgi:hypothetical protein
MIPPSSSFDSKIESHFITYVLIGYIKGTLFPEQTIPLILNDPNLNLSILV